MFCKPLALAATIAMMVSPPLFAQTTLSTHWEDLTAPDFVLALQKSNQTCMLPFGVIEKHGPSGPLGTDLMNGRYIADLATRQEYTIIFPPYYFGQIAEARSQPGTLAYPARIQMDLLQVTVDEMARNGCKKIIIQNAHGGNNMLLRKPSWTRGTTTSYMPTLPPQARTYLLQPSLQNSAWMVMRVKGKFQT